MSVEGTSVEEEWLGRVLGRLALAARRTISLDEIAEAIGLDWASPERVEALFTALEAAGHVIGEAEPVDLGPLLGRVLRAARAERAEGRATTPRALAEVTGIDAREVRVALLYADVLARGRSVPK